jgi:dUTP pyrophosphatase
MLPTLPPHLVPDCLTDAPRHHQLPFETKGLGQFADYSPWTLRVSCPPELTPTRSSSNSAGYNLRSSAKIIIIPAQGSVLLNTCCKVDFPTGHYGKIEGLSELAHRHDIITFSGVIDEDYCGDIHVKLFNMGATPYVVKAGDSIAQIVVQRYTNLNIQRKTTSVRSPPGFGPIGETARERRWRVGEDCLDLPLLDYNSRI